LPPADILAASLVNGLLTGGVYALVALGLTLIYGVLHIVNFAHGSLLMLAMFGAWLLVVHGGLDPYAALLPLTAIAFLAGWALYAGVIGRISGGDDRRILLATLGVAVVLDNLALVLFTGDTRTIDTPYAFAVVEAGPLLISVPKLISFAVALALAAAMWAFMSCTDLGRAIRAVARELDGAGLVGWLLWNMIGPAVLALIGFCFFFLLRLLLRKTWVAAAVWISLYCGLNLTGADHLPHIVLGMVDYLRHLGRHSIRDPADHPRDLAATCREPGAADVRPVGVVREQGPDRRRADIGARGVELPQRARRAESAAGGLSGRLMRRATPAVDSVEF